MDTILILGWVLACDIIMVLVTYRLAFKEGAKAKEAVEQRYKEALAEVSTLSKRVSDLHTPTSQEIVAALPPYPKIPTPQEIVAALPPVKLSDEDLAKLREAVSGAINGTVGSYMKKAGTITEDDEDIDLGDVIMKMMIKKVSQK